MNNLTPQQRSQMRKRLLKRGLPIPPELELKRGNSSVPSVAVDNTCPDCVVVDAIGNTHIYKE